jgi:hypothetical protein
MDASVLEVISIFSVFYVANGWRCSFFNSCAVNVLFQTTEMAKTIAYLHNGNYLDNPQYLSLGYDLLRSLFFSGTSTICLVDFLCIALSHIEFLL